MTICCTAAVNHPSFTEATTENIRSLYFNKYKIKQGDRVIFVGYDAKENIAYQVLKHSLESSNNVTVVPLVTNELRKAGLFERSESVAARTGQRYDTVGSATPFSTDFSFTRFLVPTIARMLGLSGWVVFMDCDFLNVGNLQDLYEELDTFAGAKLAVVKHDFISSVKVKMDGVLQTNYAKKLWSSLMCFNLDTNVDTFIDPLLVNRHTGKFLHQFEWFPHTDTDIVGLDEAYNFVPFHSEKRTTREPVLLHFTEKAPWFYGENSMEGDAYSNYWWGVHKDLLGKWNSEKETHKQLWI